MKDSPHRGIDVLCGYLCGVCRLCADILCPFRLLWLLYPVHWGSALPVAGGHPAVLCWHGIVLWLWTWSADPDRIPCWDLLCQERPGLCGHGVFVSNPQLPSFTMSLVSQFDWLLSVVIPASSTSSMWSTVWRPFSSSTVSCCWLRVSTPQVQSSRPLASSGAPSVAAASAWRWGHV